MANQEYLDFELNIEAISETQLKITVASSPVGTASVDVANPFTADEIQQVIGLLEGSIQATKKQLNTAIRDFGEELFKALFTDQIYAAYLTSQKRAGEAGLRIRLHLDNAGPLADLPFELLRDPRGDYLALSRQTPIVRHPNVLTTRPLVAVSLPLRVLVLISSPDDQEALDVDGEWRTLQNATTDLRNRGLLELERLEDAQLVTLQRKLREGANYQVFHFIGHAAFDERSDTGLLAFEDPTTGKTVPVSGEALARELSEENSIRLVVLNARYAARENSNVPFMSIASSLVARGLPAVVAMQFTIDDDTSRLFSQEFYRVLSESYPIEAAVSEARRAISSSVSGFQWATPVLYLRAANGILFPRRQRQEGRVASGGFLEAIRSPIGIVLALVVFAIIVLGGIGLTALRPKSTVVTSTPNFSVGKNVDLEVSSVRFSPPNPVPGQQVTVAMIITNRGSTDTGPFKWAWYAQNIEDNSTPSIEGQVNNLGAGTSLNVKGNFYFGLWNTYVTTAYVNFDNQVNETNLVNNIKIRSVTLTQDPFVIDFTRLPSGDVLLEPRVIKSNEFSSWGFQIAPSVPAESPCAAAVVWLEVEDTVNRLRPGLNDKRDACANVPLGFILDQPVGSATLQFFPRVAGKYTLDLLDVTGAKVSTAQVDVTSTDQPVVIHAPDRGPAVDNAQQIRFSAPENAAVEIQNITFTLPGQLLATPGK